MAAITDSKLKERRRKGGKGSGLPSSPPALIGVNLIANSPAVSKEKQIGAGDGGGHHRGRG